MNEQPENKEIAHTLLVRAAHDLKTAEHTLTLKDSECPFDIVCFHAQQCAEKALKAFLMLHGAPYQKTHEIGQLLLLCQAIDPGLVQMLDEIRNLSPYAVEIRYENPEWPERDEAEAAVSLAQKAFGVVQEKLSGQL
jgi:HEPN domain-containing protein